MFFDFARLGRLFCTVYSAVVGGWASSFLCFHGAFFIIQSAGASCLFDKHHHLNQSLCRARLFEKKNLGSGASREDFFSKTSGVKRNRLDHQGDC